MKVMKQTAPAPSPPTAEGKSSCRRGTDAAAHHGGGEVNPATPVRGNPPAGQNESVASETGWSNAGRLRRKWVRRGDYRLLGVFAIIVLVLGLFWRPIQRRCLIYLLLRADAPSRDALSEVVGQTANPSSLLLRLWRTQRIPDRHFVLRYFGKLASSKPELFHAMAPVVAQAATDPDITTRELAFELLTRLRLPQLRTLAMEQLPDADPAARLLGLDSLRSIAASNDVPVAMNMLDDPDPRVVVAAALVLRQVTGLDFGIKSSSLALPRFASMDNTNPPQAGWQTSTIRQGVQGWRNWWKEHRAEYPASVTPPLMPIHPAGLTTPNFRLNDANEKAVQLSDFRGKAVLLAFWSLDAPVSLDDAPALDALGGRGGNGVQVLGICIPPAACDDDDDATPNMPDMPNMPGMQAAPPALGTAAGRAAVRGVARQRGATYAMLIDAKGKIASRFAVEELPTYVLIDAQGRIRRLAVGNRTQPVLQALLKEALQSSSARTDAP